MSFPKSLVQYQDLIESTARPTVLMSFPRARTRPWQSKIGGIPYFPLEHPVDTYYVPHPNTVNLSPWPKQQVTGKELTLLVQINFEEMPSLPSFPSRGILQIFVDEGHWYDLARGMRAIFHAEVIKDEAKLFSAFNHDPESAVPQSRLSEHALSFEKEIEYMTVSDRCFEEKLGHVVSTNTAVLSDYFSITDRRHEAHPVLEYGRNKIGGYHYSQNGQDPRPSTPDWQDGVLLFQFQDWDRGLIWGDGGSAQLFIRQRDLENLNFSDLLFHWDST